MSLENFSRDQLAEIYRLAMKTRNRRANEPEDTKLNPPAEGPKRETNHRRATRKRTLVITAPSSE